MGGSPDISCIIPAYRNVDLLARAVTSALHQDARVEVVLTDDTPGDEVYVFASAIQPLYPQLRYVRHSPNGRPVSNWNFGLDQARGRYSVLLHHDEMLVDRTYLSDAVQALDTSGARAIVARSIVAGLNKPSRFHLVQAWAGRLGLPPWTLLAFNWVGSTACVVFRSNPALRFDPHYVNLVDVEFYLRLFGDRRPDFLPSRRVLSLGHHDRQITAAIEVGEQTVRDLHLMRANGAVSRRVIALAAAVHRLRGGVNPCPKQIS